MWGQNLVELFLKGGPIMWPLLVCSVLGLALIVERTVVVLWGAAPFRPLLRRLQELIQSGKLDQARQEVNRRRGPVARTAAVYLEHLDSPPELREEIVAREASQLVTGMEKRLSWLGLLAQVTPLLGLLGTVLGLMNAFYQIDVKGSQVQASDLAVGIWQKLLNTAFGMSIAIPCLIAFFWLSGRVNLTALQMEWVTSYLNEWCRKMPSRGGEAPAAPPAGSPSSGPQGKKDEGEGT